MPPKQRAITQQCPLRAIFTAPMRTQFTSRLRSHSLVAALAVTLLSALVTVVVLWQGTDGEGWKQTIRSDAKG